jgi:hypothetical protein
MWQIFVEKNMWQIVIQLAIWTLLEIIYILLSLFLYKRVPGATADI